MFLTCWQGKSKFEVIWLDFDQIASIFLFFGFRFCFRAGLRVFSGRIFPSRVFAFWVAVAAPEFAAAFFRGEFFDELALAALRAFYTGFFLNFFNVFALRIGGTADEKTEPTLFYLQYAFAAFRAGLADLFVFRFDFVFLRFFFGQLFGAFACRVIRAGQELAETPEFF